MRVNVRTLKHFCQAEITDFYKYGQVYEINNRRYTYIDRHSKVLAVAHLDTVLEDKTFDYVQLKNDTVVYSSELDDRLGVYAILSYLPALGAHFDVLLTEDEESGMSTAREFFTDKNYNWIAEFDRRGDGVVMYQYEDQDMRDLMSKYGLRVYRGTFTDICELEHLGCKAFNFGVGYDSEHSTYCNVSLNLFQRQMAMFMKFYWAYRKIHLPHTPVPYDHRWRNYNSWYDNGEQYDSSGYSIDSHGKMLARIAEKFGPDEYDNADVQNYDKFYCESCGKQLNNPDFDYFDTGLCNECLSDM